MTLRSALRLSLLLAAAVPVLLSCASRQAEQAITARSALVGLSKQTLLSCAGVPPRSRTEGDVEYYTYGSGDIRGFGNPSVGFGIGLFGGGSNVGGGIGFDTAARDASSDYCEATFTIIDGRVSQINYSSFSGVGNARYAQCYNIVANCLAVSQRQPAPVGGQP